MQTNKIIAIVHSLCCVVYCGNLLNMSAATYCCKLLGNLKSFTNVISTFFLQTCLHVHFIWSSIAVLVSAKPQAQSF